MDSARDYDVIVIGAGGAGLAAAFEASSAGANTLLVEAGERVGGSTALAGGVIYAAGTSVQRAAGVQDSADAMFNYCATITQNRMDAALIRRLCDESADLIEWLKNLGAEFKPERLFQLGMEGADVKRSHCVEGEGTGLVALLDAAVSRQSVDIAMQTRVEHLLTDTSGAVCGIRAGDDDIRAGAVVLACGGFGHNQPMVKELYPEVAQAAGDWLWHIGNVHSMGDGLTMAKQVGATLGGGNRGLIAVAPRFARDDLLLPEWLLLVNSDGRRFMREFLPYGLRARTILDQPGKKAFALFDEAARCKSKPKKSPIMGIMPYTWTDETIQQMVAQGHIAAASTLDGLAEKIGVNSHVLATTVELYNRDCEAGSDSVYKKNPQALLSLSVSPYYAVELRPATLAGTFAGVRIDRDAEALDQADRPVAGLYAAGETTCAMADLYVGGGNSIANALIFGRIAGKNAAAWAQKVSA